MQLRLCIKLVSLHSGYERGLRYDDPTFGIDWPHLSVKFPKDAAWPMFNSASVFCRSLGYWKLQFYSSSPLLLRDDDHFGVGGENVYIQN